ncbi:DUF7696 family protein [Microvirga lenta]
MSTWSDEWQHECEAGTVLAMSKAERDAFFNGSIDQEGKRKGHGIIAIGGQAAAEKLRGYMEKILEA